MINCAKGVRVHYHNMENQPWVFGVTGSSEEEVREFVDAVEARGDIVNSDVEEFNQPFKADKIVSLEGLMMFIGRVDEEEE
jgi:hypothetical protein